MAVDGLSTPLGRKKENAERPWHKRLPLGAIGFGIILALVVFVVLWTTVADDPEGGEPLVEMTLPKPVERVSSSEMQVVDIQPNRNGTGDDRARNMIESVDAPNIPAPPSDGPLSTQPIPKISEKTRVGILPRIAEDGSRPLDLYAAAAPGRSSNIPKVAVVVTGLGLSQTGTQRAIRQLPRGVTLAFSPYGNSLDRWTQKARETGHELLVQVPLEPFDYPQNDPGPHTLLTNLKTSENINRLHWLMTRLTNYVGVVSYMGARFTASGKALAPVLEEIANRGLLYLDDGGSTRSVASGIADASRTPFARADLVIDAIPTAEEIDLRLLQLESIARSKGIAVATASALPISIERITSWANALERRGLVLVPISVTVKASR